MRDFSQAAKWADFPGEETAISADGNELNESLPGDSDPALPEWQITEGGHLPAHMGIGIDPQRPRALRDVYFATTKPDTRLVASVLLPFRA